MLFGALAEFERELIRARTSEDRARAKARGKSLAWGDRSSSPITRISNAVW
ncbi:MAG: recombinase family protein [Methylocella sp.]